MEMLSECKVSVKADSFRDGPNSPLCSSNILQSPHQGLEPDSLPLGRRWTRDSL